MEKKKSSMEKLAIKTNTFNIRDINKLKKIFINFI